MWNDQNTGRPLHRMSNIGLSCPHSHLAELKSECHVHFKIRTYQRGRFVVFTSWESYGIDYKMIGGWIFIKSLLEENIVRCFLLILFMFWTIDLASCDCRWCIISHLDRSLPFHYLSNSRCDCFHIEKAAVWDHFSISEYWLFNTMTKVEQRRVYLDLRISISQAGPRT